MRDLCETEIAQIFEPLIEFHSQEHTQIREPKFAAQPMPFGNGVAIMYMLAYHEDGGVAGVSGHSGDSEFLIVEVGPDGPNWRFYQVFTSAHYMAPGDRSEWNSITGYPFSTVDAPRVRIYAAKNKHANYVNTGNCHVWESCGGGWVHYAMLGEWVNIGSASYPFDIDTRVGGHPYCAGSLWVAQPTNTECFRGPTHFLGWNIVIDGSSTPYGTLLGIFGF